jgi:K319-like protein/putative Ig domain-containing protein
METPFKSITNIQRWRLAAITLGSALAMSLASTAFAVKPNITSPTTATGQVGVTYTTASPLYQITANNSPTSFGTTVSIPGISFDSTTGKFTGTPTTAGTFSGNITATNSSGTGMQNLTVTINPQAPVINSSGTASGKVGVSYTTASPLYQITATNSPTSYSTTVSIPGISFSTSTGKFTGTPTTANTYSGTISATNAGGTGSQNLTVTIAPPAPTITSSGTASGTAGSPFSYQIKADQPIPSGGWATTVSIAGVNFSATTGAFSGTPTNPAGGTFSGTISATNANGTGSQNLSVTIAPQPHTTPTVVGNISLTEVYAGDTVTLDSTGSDTNPPGGTLQYNWLQKAPSTPTISLAPNGVAPIATFAAPVPPGTSDEVVTFQLKVTDKSASPPLTNTSSNLSTTVHPLPAANAGPDQNVDQGTTVMLNGSGSTGYIGFTYTWTAPVGITFDDTGTQTSSLPNPTFTAPAFTPPNGMSYTFTLVVTEQRPGFPPKASLPDQVVIMVKQPPIALTNLVNDITTASRTTEGDAGESSCSYTTTVTLYGFGVDPDQDTFAYAWTQVHDTSGAPPQQGDPAVQLSDTSSQTPSFIAPDVPNGIQQIDLVFQLIVNDGTINSAPAYVTVHVLNTNDPPIAALTVNGQMPDINNAVNGVPASSQVTLDGSTSSDPNPNTTLTYTWTQINPDPAYPITGFSTNPQSPLATFTAPAVSFQQHSITLTFQLTVSDGDCTDTKQVSIMVVNNNRPPIADAGQTQTVPEASTAVLGSDPPGSYDPDNDPITYQWTQVHDTTGAPLQPGDPVIASLTPVEPDSHQVSFVAPTFGGLGGSVTFQLIVTDSHGAPSTPSYTLVNVYPNRPPVPSAGQDQTVDEHTTVALSGSGMDADNNPLTYTWNHVHDTSGAPPLPTDLPVTVAYQNPNDPSNPNASFTAPEVPCGGGTVVMRLTVNDGYVDAYAYVTININNVNNNPTADAGSPQNVNENQTVLLNGSNSSDIDPGETQTLTFAWTQTSGPTVALSDPTAASPTFTAPQIAGGDPNKSVDLAFHLVVSDGCGGSGASDTTVHVANIPHSPTAMATGPATANEGGNTVTLDGTGSSDPDGDPLTYSWLQTGGPTVTLSDPNSATPTFSTPWVSANTPLTFQLTVTDPYVGIDGDVASVATVTVTVVNINTPPTLSNPRADVPVLWPPDHRMVQVHILGVVDPDQPPYNATITIDKVTQDEATNGLGDGDTPIDAVITHKPGSDDTLLLRAERSGKGNGRVYHVHFTASDPESRALGNSPTGVVTVTVPHDKKTDAAIDGGELFDSTH